MWIQQKRKQNLATVRNTNPTINTLLEAPCYFYSLANLKLSPVYKRFLWFTIPEKMFSSPSPSYAAFESICFLHKLRLLKCLHNSHAREAPETCKKSLLEYMVPYVVSVAVVCLFCQCNTVKALLSEPIPSCWYSSDLGSSLISLKLQHLIAFVCPANSQLHTLSQSENISKSQCL